MKYCYECGTKLELRYLKNEGEIPFCTKCDKFRFPIFNTAISTVIFNENKDKVLLIQQYGKHRNVLVAGYINKGESAEQALVREVKEEMGLKVIKARYNKSEYFEPTNTLMINYASVVEGEDLSGMTEEVDQAAWYPIEEARKEIFHNSLAERFLLSCFQNLS